MIFLHGLTVSSSPRFFLPGEHLHCNSIAVAAKAMMSKNPFQRNISMSAKNGKLKRAIVLASREELQLAATARTNDDLDLAFHHYERAHILSQQYTILHIKSHLGMLRIGLMRRDVREILGQCIRVVAALVFSRIWIPLGNTGGANVSALKPMQIPDDLRQLLEGASSNQDS